MLDWIYAACLVFVVVVLPAISVGVVKGAREGFVFLEFWFSVIVEIPLTIFYIIASIFG